MNPHKDDHIDLYTEDVAHTPYIRYNPQNGTYAVIEYRVGSIGKFTFFSDLRSAQEHCRDTLTKILNMTESTKEI